MPSLPTHLRGLLLVLLAFVFLGLPFAAPVAAQPTEPMEHLRDAMVNILDILKNDELRKAENEEELLSRLRAEVYKIFDFRELSMRAVGRPWRSFTEEEREEFTKHFTRLLENTYIDHLRSYSGQSIDYGSVRFADNDTKVEIETFIVSPDKRIPIAYRMQEDGGWKVYDVIVEGVSLVKNYRTQFREILLNGKPADLIEAVRQKNI